MNSFQKSLIASWKDKYQTPTHCGVCNKRLRGVPNLVMCKCGTFICSLQCMMRGSTRHVKCASVHSTDVIHIVLPTLIPVKTRKEYVLLPKKFGGYAVPVEVITQHYYDIINGNGVCYHLANGMKVLVDEKEAKGAHFFMPSTPEELKEHLLILEETKKLYKHNQQMSELCRRYAERLLNTPEDDDGIPDLSVKTYKLKSTPPPLQFDAYDEEAKLAIVYLGKEYLSPQPGTLYHFGCASALDKYKEAQKLREAYCERKGIRLITVKDDGTSIIEQLKSQLKPSK